MPYNTRRKSLSLPSLGIQLPNASRAHRSPSSNKATPSEPLPPTKRVKRSHESDPPSPPSSVESNVVSPTKSSGARPKSRRGYEHTPPPSPEDTTDKSKIDTDGINDDIVIAVIEQLEKTGNRPHLIKELATVLQATTESVANSANPAALLSSRLSLYLKRPWTALSPCPLAKELIPVHPRKVFYYLTTSEHQSLPENSDDIIAPAIGHHKLVTPSISTPSVDQDDLDVEIRERARLSPSPEIDLSTPDDEDLGDAPMTTSTTDGSFSSRSSLGRDGSIAESQPPQHRAPSPPLEADERGFTETATAVRRRGMSLHEPTVRPSTEGGNDQIENQEEAGDTKQHRDQEFGFELFGHQQNGLAAPAPNVMMSSPMMQPRELHVQTETKKPSSEVTVDTELKDVDMTSAWELMSPETVEVEELDNLFAGF
ncbi:MAG: hypothetical protein Q9227_003469 [Pyrenula ochraceoflavens]